MTMTNPDPFRTYLQELQRNLSTGSATEHTHRSALQALLEALGDGVQAINEPQRVECGAPDYILTRAGTPIGYVEAKDIGASLDAAERSEQLGRYRASLNNLILTDYLEFRSPTYRQRYAEFLKIDFPRLPLTSDRALFKALAEKGEELVALHLMESPLLNQLITGFPVSGSNEVGRVRYTEPRHKEETSEVLPRVEYTSTKPSISKGLSPTCGHSKSAATRCCTSGSRTAGAASYPLTTSSTTRKSSSP
jgi:hypothetical protein